MRDDPFLSRYPEPDPEEWWHRDAGDDRLRHVVYVDGRLVDSWTTSVFGTRWEEHARRFDDERRPALPPLPPPRPAHEQALDWLDGLVGGRDAVLALTEEAVRPPAPPTFADADQGAVHGAVADLLDRVAGQFFDTDVAAVLEWALAALWERRPSFFSAAHPANATAGGLLWVVGRANGLYSGGFTQTTVQRELWLRVSLSTAGQRIAPVLRGVTLTAGHRPQGAPDLLGFAEPQLLTPTTRRLLLRWRDQALVAQRHARSVVLPSEVES